ncbi:MAG: hypothetical protein ACI8WY_003405, partial [Planctomycetota bacterium]
MDRGYRDWSKSERFKRSSSFHQWMLVDPALIHSKAAGNDRPLSCAGNEST